MPSPLELNGDEFRTLVSAAVDRIASHLDSLDRQPAQDVDGAADVARSLQEPIPETGADLPEILDLLFDRAIPKSFNAAGPGYLAYIPGGGLPHSAVADLIADAVNRYTGVWLAAPGLVQLEANVLRWFCEMVGYPDGALGILTTGGSLANFSAIVTARRERLPPDFLRGTIYVSDQVHHSVDKAAALAGFPAENVRVVASDERFRVRLNAIEHQIAADRAEGYQPFLVVASAGTVNTGAVDPLDDLASLCARLGLWLHVDGAYGGFFVLTERGKAALRGIERADSITLDPHKGLFVPYGTGSLLVKDGAALARAHSAHASYLPAMQDGSEFVDFCQVSPELSRSYRGLRIWLPFKLAGVGAFRDALDEKLDLAHLAAGRLRDMPEIEIVAEPQLSIVAFRARRAGMDPEQTNELNQRLLDAVNRRRRVFLTATTVAGELILRICVLSFRTHRDRIEACLEDIAAALHEI